MPYLIIGIRGQNDVRLTVTQSHPTTGHATQTITETSKVGQQLQNTQLCCVRRKYRSALQRVHHRRRVI